MAGGWRFLFTLQYGCQGFKSIHKGRQYLTVGRVFHVMALLALAEEIKTNPQQDSQPLVEEQ